MSPDSPTARDADGGAAPSVRRAVDETDDQGPTYGDVLGASLSSLRGLWRDRIFQTGLLIVFAALLLKVYVLSRSYFVEDDFLFFAAANAGDLSPEYLLELHKGHFMPGALFLVYVQTAFGPYHWLSAAGTMLVLQGTAILAFFRLVWELFGRRWALLVPLTVYALAPLTIPVLGWWSAALNAVPFQLAIVLALLWTVRYLRTDNTLFAWWAGGAVVFGMLFSVKAVFLPPLLLARHRLVPDILHQLVDLRVLAVDVGPLKHTRQETRTPILRPRVRKAPRTHHHKRRQILALIAQTVGYPGTDARKPHPRHPAVHHEQRRRVVVVDRTVLAVDLQGVVRSHTEELDQMADDRQSRVARDRLEATACGRFCQSELLELVPAQPMFDQPHALVIERLEGTGKDTALREYARVLAQVGLDPVERQRIRALAVATGFEPVPPAAARGPRPHPGGGRRLSRSLPRCPDLS